MSSACSFVDYSSMSSAGSSTSSAWLHQRTHSTSKQHPPPHLVVDDSEDEGSIAITIPPSSYEGEKAAEVSLQLECQTLAWDMWARMSQHKGLISPSPAEEDALNDFMTSFGLEPDADPAPFAADQEVFSLEW
eukprot:TRINITY_DN23042_c0_g1_i1.p2 TRINITY_DN23042_c0_g1~~TRINITY_DN23042_c0_g1_i1.p2  ORF type:complete len:133 (-),score=15.65 TRINITY_DN23042_c0_g1_i1:589-987(-)